MSDLEPAGRPRSRPAVPAAWRRGIFLTLLAGLIGGNAWLLRRQFPSEDARRNEAYDRGLRALDLDKDYARAEVEFRRYLEIDDAPRARLLLALALQAQGKTAESRREFAAVLTRDPSMDQARLGIVEIAQADQDYDEAFRQLLAAEAELPTPVDVWILHARLLTDVGDLDGAIAVYRKALSADSGSFEAHLGIADLLSFRSILTGRVDERQSAAGSYREAEVLIKSRLARADDRRLRTALARAIAGQVVTLAERDLAEAARQLREVAAGDPADPEPTLLLARFLHEAKDDLEARRTFEDAATRWPGPRTAIALHDFYASTGEEDLATRTLVDAIPKHREDAGVRIRLVGWYVATGRMAEAERELASAATVLSTDWRVHEARGDLARERARRAAAAGSRDAADEDRATALAAYRLALEGRPRSPRLKKKAAEQLIETMLARGGKAPGEALTADEEFARRCIDDVLRVNRSDAEALEWQARLLLAEGRAREVAESLRGQLDAPQPSVSALRLLGIAAVRSGDDRTAAAALVRVVDLLAPRDAEDRRDARRAAPEDWANAVQACVRAGLLDEGVRLAREAMAAWSASPRVVVAAAAVAIARDDVGVALPILADGRERFPGDAEVRLVYARALELAGRIDDAGRELESAATEIGSDEARLAYLDFLGRTGRLESAEQGFLAMIASSPSNPAGHLRLGDFYLALRPPRRDAALREFEIARDTDPSDPAPWLRIADLRLQEAKADPKAYAAAEDATLKYEERAPGDVHADYLRGKLALVAGRTDEALERLQRFAAAEPDLPAGQYYLAVALRGSGRDADALAPLEKAVRLAPRDDAARIELAKLHYELGVAAFRNGDFEAARQLFARADAGGSGQSAKLLMAGAAANAGKLDVSESEVRALLATDPGDRMASHLLASILLRRGTREALAEAQLLFESVLRADPEDMYAALGVATSRFAQGFPKDALEAFRRVYPRTNGNPEVALAMCQCMAATANLQGAVDFLDSEAAAHPGAWQFPHIKGDFLVHLKRWDLAVDAYLEASRRDPALVGPPLAAASALMTAGRLEDARKLLIERQAGAKEPALIAVALGDVLAHMGRMPEAQDQLRRALALAPGHPRALYLLGRIAEDEGKIAEARKLYRSALDRGAPDADCHARFARILAAEKDFAGAREAWLGALRLAPRDPLYLNNLALAAAEDPARLDEAIGHAANAASLAPERGEIADTYGWLLYRAGRYPEAAVMLVRAASLLETTAVVQFHAGMALSKIGRAPEARSRLERALAIDAKFSGADEARAEIDRLK